MNGIEAVVYERHFEGPSKNDAKDIEHMLPYTGFNMPLPRWSALPYSCILLLLLA
jgi:hypothetical protein